MRQIIALLEDTLRREQPAKPPNLRVPAEREPSGPLRWAPSAINLAGLPTELLRQLRSAVRDGEKDRLDELIAAVAKQDPHSARALKDLADKYEYDTLTSLLTEATQ